MTKKELCLQNTIATTTHESTPIFHEPNRRDAGSYYFSLVLPCPYGYEASVNRIQRMSENSVTRDTEPYSDTKSRDGDGNTVLRIHHTHGFITDRRRSRDSNNLREDPLVALYHIQHPKTT